MHRDLPLPVVVLEGGAGGLIGVETFAQVGGDAAGGFFVAGQAGRDGFVHAGRRWPEFRRRAMGPRGDGTAIAAALPPEKEEEREGRRGAVVIVVAVDALEALSRGVAVPSSYCGCAA